MIVFEQFSRVLKAHQRWVLVALLVALHLTLLAGANSTVSLMCWLVDFGLFLLWQPFIQTERRLDSSMFLLLVLVLAAGIWLFGWWLLILWTIALAALLGGRVMMLGHRPTRIVYLLAFAYFLAALLLWLVPRVVPGAELLGPSLDKPFVLGAPLVFIAMLLMPRPREIRLPNAGMVDFFYSLFIFLLISVLVLGSLAFMLLRQASYVEAVFKTLVSMSIMLLLIAWAWNPRPGFSGIGMFLSRYLLTLGLPFETWLQRLMECAETENDPDKFLQTACEGMLELPWVSGGAWRTAEGWQGGKGSFGQASRFQQDFPIQPLVITLYTQHKLSPSLVWHFHLLSQLTNEYYFAKQRGRELQQMGYLRAVHETGARLTHDVKNLLQSLNNLCYVAQTPEAEDTARLTQILRRQLPQITQRLQQTLEKLQVPGSPSHTPDGNGGLGRADVWWEALRQRYAHDEIVFSPVIIEATARIPFALFDSVVDNLLHNSLIKRQSEKGLVIVVTVSTDGRCLQVRDTGSAVRLDLVSDLFRMPVASENGLGIGLYHAAKQAESYGYQLRLANNADGEVCFELSQKVIPAEDGIRASQQT